MKQLEGGKLLQHLKGLFEVFTNKLLFVEWLLEIIRSIAIYLLKVKARLETDVFIEDKEDLDLRKVPPSVKSNIIYDEKVLKARWDACLSCEFLTDSNRCTKCGCFMKVKHKIAHASCPIKKWDKYVVTAS